MRQNVNIDFLRSRFEALNNYYGVEKGINPNTSILRIEEELVNGQGVYQFNLRKENLLPWERNLKRNDLFLVTHMGFFLSIHNPAKPGKESLLSYAIRGGGGVEDFFSTTDINALYNGFFEMITGTVQNFSALPMALFKKVPQNQPSILALDDGNGTTTGDETQPAFNFLESMHTPTEQILFAGTQDHRLRVAFPTFPTSDYSANTPSGEQRITKLVFIALGFNVPGGTNPEFQTDLNNMFRVAI